MTNQKPLSPRLKELLDQAHRPQAMPQQSGTNSTAHQLANKTIPILYHNAGRNRKVLGLFLFFGVGFLLVGIITMKVSLMGIGVMVLGFLGIVTSIPAGEAMIDPANAPTLVCENGLLTGQLACPVPIEQASFSIRKASRAGHGKLHIYCHGPDILLRHQALALEQFRTQDQSMVDEDDLRRLLLELGMHERPKTSLEKMVGKLVSGAQTDKSDSFHQ